MWFSEIKKLYPNAQRSTCCENNCKLCISNIKNYRILKGDLLVSSEKMCDCMIFRNDKKIILVELKTTKFNAYKVIEQLTNAGKKALSITSGCGGKNFTIYYLLVVKKRFRNNIQLEILLRHRININGKKYIIKKCRCRDPLERYID